MRSIRRCTAWLLTLVLLIGAMSGLTVAAEATIALESLYFTDASGAVLLAPQGHTACPNVCVTYAEGATLGGDVTVTLAADDGTTLGTHTFAANTATVVHTETYQGEVRCVLQGAAITVPSNATDIRAALQNTVAWAPASDADAYIGEILFPEPFYSMMKGKFTISREDGVREYSTTMNADSFHDWSKATEIFLSTTVNFANAEVKTRLGTERDKPITARNFVAQYKAGAYKTADGAVQNSFIFTLLDDFYSGKNDAYASNVHGIPLNNSQYNANLKLGADVAIDALIRSGSPSGFTWMGSIKTQDDPFIVKKWAPLEGYNNVYSIEQTTWQNTQKVITLFNFAAADENGIPRPYVFVDTVAEVEATPGTFTQLSDDLATIYCHPRAGEQVADIVLQWEDNFLAGIRHESACSKQTVVFENIGFMPRTTDHINNQFGGGDFDKAVFAYLGCKFTGGINNTLSLIGKYTAYLNNCVAAYGFRDNFNYHSAAPNGEGSRVIEVNCRAYGNGDFNRINGCPALSADTANANNCSTAHDNMYILRVGGRYTDSQGHHVGDTATNMSLNIGCEAYNIVTSPSHATTFSFKTQPQAWVVDSYATGTRVRYGIQSGETNTTVLGNRGRQLAGLVDNNTVYTLPTLTWEQVARGVWTSGAPLKAVSSITLTDMKTVYQAGEAIDRTQGTVTVTFEDGTSAAMAYAYGAITVTGYDTNKGGKQTVTVTYGGVSATYTVQVEGGVVILGDVDGSGAADSTDARLTLQYAVGKITADALDLSVADVNGSGAADSTDARLILQYAVGKIEEFPAAPTDGGALSSDFFNVTTASDEFTATVDIDYQAAAPLLDGQFVITYPTALELTAIDVVLPNVQYTHDAAGGKLYLGFIAEEAIAAAGDALSLTFRGTADTAVTVTASHVVTAADVRYTGVSVSVPITFVRYPFAYTVTDGNATITGVTEDLVGVVTIPDTIGGYPVTAIARFALAECDELTEIVLPRSVTAIPNWLFAGCDKLAVVTLPAGVAQIGMGAFAGCPALDEVRYDGGVADAAAIVVDELNTDLTDARWVYLNCSHEWDDGVVTIQPAYGVSGEKTYSCRWCEATRTEVMAPLGDAAVVDGIYYFKGEKVPNAGLVEVDGYYYYVVSGSKVKIGRYAISNVNDTGVAKGIYHFFEDGKMNTAVGVYDGYYYNATGRSEAYVGLTEWNGAKYYVSDGGKVTVGRYFITKLNGLVPKKRAYTFFDDGRMLEDTRIYKDGYYYVDGIRTPYAGLVEYEGAFYYVSDNGAYVKGQRALVSNVNATDKAKGYYYFDDNGQMACNVVRDGRYYGADGLAPYNAGVVKVDGNYYYVGGTHGALRTNYTVTVTAKNANGLLTPGKYYADANGILTPAA